MAMQEGRSHMFLVPVRHAVLFSALLTACGSPPEEPTGMPSPTEGIEPTATAPAESLPPASPSVSPDGTDTPTATASPTPRPPSIPRNTRPCEHPEYWPLSRASKQVPILLHYQPDADEATLQEVMTYLEQSWIEETQRLGFRAPLDDTGICGPDGAFDVFLWPGIDSCYVDASQANLETPYEDTFSYMVLDAWGAYAGPMLDATLAHELNHACQAADDWWDSPIIFEMTSTFIEDAVYDDDDEYMDLLEAFQSRPDWSLDRNDYYLTWYMYGAAMTLFFIKDRYFEGDFAWTSTMWLNMRNPPGAADDPSLNEPDFIDALDALLQTEASTTFFDAVLELARWRYYTGARDDGAHFEEGALFPASAEVATDHVQLTAGTWSPSPAPMLLGMSYLTLHGEPNQQVALRLTQEAPRLEPVDGVAPQRGRLEKGAQPTDAGARMVLQAVPALPGAGGDGETLGEGAGPFSLTLMPDGTRTVVITVLPGGEYDPDTRADTRFPLTLTVQGVDTGRRP